MEALNENARIEPPMVQKEDMKQLLFQTMKEFEQNVSNTAQNIATMIQGMSQKITTRGIEIGQGSGQHSIVYLMKNDLTQELKLGGHKMPYDFNLEKTDFSLKENDQFIEDDEESETKSMKWSDINLLDNLTQECKMPYDLHFEKK